MKSKNIEPNGAFERKNSARPNLSPGANVQVRALSTEHAWSPTFLETSFRFKTLASLGVDFSTYQTWPSLDVFNELLARFEVRNAKGMLLSCLPCPPKPRSKKRRETLPSYETYVLEFGLIPTRLENWHDFCNLLVWCRFPKTKAVLNKLQARPHGVARNRYQELLTMFDEGGVIRVFSPATDESMPQQIALRHFGHALYEADLRGYKNSSGFTLKLVSKPLDFSLDSSYRWMDESAADLIASGGLVKWHQSQVWDNTSGQ